MRKSAQKSPLAFSKVMSTTFFLLLTLIGFHPAQAAEFSNSRQDGLHQDPPPDPCDLIPDGGTISTQSETTCVAQFAEEPGEKIVQIDTITSGLDQETLCDGLKQPSDFHVFMNDAFFGDCGIEVEVGYQGEPAPGYTGWAVIYYYQGIHIRVATSQDHPGYQGWVYDTAQEIENIMRAQLSDTPSAVEESNALPPWLENDLVFVDRDWTVYEVPEWLDWIKPKRVIRSRGVVMPWDKGGEIWVYNQTFDKWTGPIRGQVVLYTGDMIATGPNTSARVYFSNGEISDGISVGSDTLLEVPGLPEDYTSEHPTLWTLYKGFVKIKRAVLKEVPEYDDNPFIIRTMTCVAGSRGTEFIVTSDPIGGVSGIHLLSGELNVYNLAAAGPEDEILTAGNTLVVTANGDQTVLEYDESFIQSIMDSQNLAGGEEIPSGVNEELLGEIPTAEEMADVEETPAAVGLSLTFILLTGLVCLGLVLVIGLIIVGVVFLMKRKKAGR